MLKQPVKVGCKGRWVANSILFFFLQFLEFLCIWVCLFLCLLVFDSLEIREGLEFLEPYFKKSLQICFFCSLLSLIRMISQEVKCGRQSQGSFDVHSCAESASSSRRPCTGSDCWAQAARWFLLKENFWVHIPHRQECWSRGTHTSHSQEVLLSQRRSPDQLRVPLNRTDNS